MRSIVPTRVIEVEVKGPLLDDMMRMVEEHPGFVTINIKRAVPKRTNIRGDVASLVIGLLQNEPLTFKDLLTRLAPVGVSSSSLTRCLSGLRVRKKISLRGKGCPYSLSGGKARGA